jgi:PIN domain nuclease of toxin-antitoxin system
VFVTDTHPLVHHAFARKPLPGKEARRIFEDAEAGKTIVFIPSVVFWEVSLLVKLGRIQLTQTFEHWCRSLDNKPGFSIVSLEWLDIKEARHLPFSDPWIASSPVRPCTSTLP